MRKRRPEGLSKSCENSARTAGRLDPTHQPHFAPLHDPKKTQGDSHHDQAHGADGAIENLQQRLESKGCSDVCPPGGEDRAADDQDAWKGRAPREINKAAVDDNDTQGAGNNNPVKQQSWGRPHPILVQPTQTAPARPWRRQR